MPRYARSPNKMCENSLPLKGTGPGMEVPKHLKGQGLGFRFWALVRNKSEGGEGPERKEEKEEREKEEE